MVATGERDPKAFADLIMRNPASRDDVIAALHGTMGNAFVNEVMSANGAPSTSVAGATPAATSKSPKDAAAPAQTVPGGHQSYEIKLEFGEGSVTGGLTATLEIGQTGAPLGAAELKALENTASLKLNGLVGRMETAILNGELDAEIFEGLKIAFEANVLQAGIDSDGDADVDLLSVSLKIVGDAGHLLNLPPHMTLTVDGRLTVALGGKIAAKLASFTVAQLEQRMLVKELDEVGEAVAKNAAQVKELEATADLLESQGKHTAAAEAREKALKHKLQVSSGKKQLAGLTDRLKAAKDKANKAITKLKGKVAAKVAKAMEKKAVKFIATKLMKLVPVLNLISTITDVVELIGLLRNLINFEYGGNGGNGDGDKEKGDKDTGYSGPKPEEGTKQAEDLTAPGVAADPDTKQARETAQNELSPAARSILGAITRPGDGPQLDPDQIKMVGLLVPADLSADELAQVLSTLRAQQSKAKSAEEVIEAIDKAVRAVRNKMRTVKVNGVDRPDLAGGGKDDENERANEGAGGSEGPITSPRQVAGLTSASEVVRSGDPAVIGRWFRSDGQDLVWTSEGRAWQRANEQTELDAEATLLSVSSSTRTIAGGWSLTVSFVFTVDGEEREKSHHFFVLRGGADDGFGAKVGDLKFEPYRMASPGPP